MTSSLNSPAAIAAYLAGRSSEAVFAIGPVVWRPSDGLAARRFYMTIATGDASGEAYFTEITLGAGLDLDATRASIIFALMRQREPSIIHDFPDELAMARRCEALWPGEKTTRLRATMEAECAARTGTSPDVAAAEQRAR